LFVSFEEEAAMDTGKREMTTSFQYVICFDSATTAYTSVCLD